MAKVDFASVDAYIAAQPEEARNTLVGVRSAIRKGAPDAEESISYKIPAYKVNGRVLLYFAGWKRHYSLYPADVALVAEFQDELASYEVEKGTIRFPLGQPVPAKLIERMARFRARDIRGRAKKAKAT